MIFNTNFSYSENTVRSMTAADDTIHNQWIGSGLKWKAFVLCIWLALD